MWPNVTRCGPAPDCDSPSVQALELCGDSVLRLDERLAEASGGVSSLLERWSTTSSSAAPEDTQQLVTSLDERLEEVAPASGWNLQCPDCTH